MRRAAMLSLVGCSALLAATWAVTEARSADTPPEAAKSAEPAKSVEPPPVVQTMPAKATVSVLGKPVVDKENRQVGRVIDVLVDASGEPQAAVLDFGGFLGVGNRRIAVHWAALHFDPEGTHPVQLELTPDELKTVPEYRGSSKPAPVVTPARVTAPLAETPPPAEAAPSAPAPGTSAPVLTIAPPSTNAAVPPTAAPGVGTPPSSGVPPGANTPAQLNAPLIAPPIAPSGVNPQAPQAVPPGSSPPKN
jgi:PRC-barrel domain